MSVDTEMGIRKVQFALDPGNIETAMVIVDRVSNEILFHTKSPNEDVLKFLKEKKSDYGVENINLAIEMVASYGMPVGRSVFDTCVWIGRFAEAWGGDFRLIVRMDVKMHLCNSTRAKDSNIRQALMDRFGSSRELAIGTKKNPGPMYGLNNDERAALAVAYTALETNKEYILGEMKEMKERKKK